MTLYMCLRHCEHHMKSRHWVALFHHKQELHNGNQRTVLFWGYTADYSPDTLQPEGDLSCLISSLLQILISVTTIEICALLDLEDQI